MSTNCYWGFYLSPGQFVLHCPLWFPWLHDYKSYCQPIALCSFEIKAETTVVLWHTIICAPSLFLWFSMYFSYVTAIPPWSLYLKHSKCLVQFKKSIQVIKAVVSFAFNRIIFVFLTSQTNTAVLLIGFPYRYTSKWRHLGNMAKVTCFLQTGKWVYELLWTFHK